MYIDDKLQSFYGHKLQKPFPNADEPPQLPELQPVALSNIPVHPKRE